MIALGKPGVGPAYYLENMKYAHDHLDPDEYVIVISMGSDYKNSSIELEEKKPEEYIFYELNPDGGATLHPGSIKARDEYRSHLEHNIGPLYRSVGAILKSYVLFPQVLRAMGRAVREALGLRDSDAWHAADSDIDQQLEHMGLGASVLRSTPDARATKAIQTTHAILARCQEYAESTGARLRLVSIPRFFGAFYQQPEQQEWVTSFGEYDLFALERALTEFAAARGIDLLAVGAGLMAAGARLESIRALYHANGRGHLTPEGHAHLAGAIAGRFYRD